MTEFDDVLTDIGALDVLPADAVLDPGLAEPAVSDLSTTEVWTAEVWWEFEAVETEIAGTAVALPDPFQPATGFSAGAAVGGWLARRRARRDRPAS